MTTLIAAFGSAHGADNLSWLVADSLQQGLSASADKRFQSIAAVPIKIRKYLHPSASIAELANYKGVIFLDAMLSEEHAYGEIVIFSAQQMEVGNGNLSTHQTGLNDAVHLARILGTLPALAKVVAMNVHPHAEVSVPASLQDAFLQSLVQEIGNFAAGILFRN